MSKLRFVGLGNHEWRVIIGSGALAGFSSPLSPDAARSARRSIRPPRLGVRAQAGPTPSRDGTALPGGCCLVRVRPERFRHSCEPSATFCNLIRLGLSPAGRVILVSF